MTDAANPYLPLAATVVEVVDETPAIKTLRMTLDDPAARAAFTYRPGQVVQLSVYGVGEATFVLNSTPTRPEFLQCSVMRAGEVTEALHALRTGDQVGLRGPLGNAFPLDALRGRDVLLVAGGIGMAPLRTLLLYMLDNRADFGTIRLLYGARGPRDMAYGAELEQWAAAPGLELTLTVDAPDPGWPHRTGLIPNVLRELAPSPEGAVAVTCGPPIMIRFTVQALRELGFADAAIVTTLERRMKCGIGLCGRCNIGPRYVCVDGPVFTMAELGELPAEL
ncbi:FAD/NAD(P)-binding protein [Desulfocurvus vexinensis]|uniref:FAD/NAD(P)-binding protein n=1 Tax=Desulfocurvus vexinensis TaxID=399548 RepID=UPI00048E50EF|nr:FAD/NAD(P)-binding protein [Desulfocurvus vexinensis]